MNATVTVSAIGILVSGVVGPAISSWANRRADAQRFERDQAGKRRDDLRAVVDDAATLLAVGATNVRQIREARAFGRSEPPDVRDWASNVHALQQRLLIRIGAADPVAVTYARVREALVALDQPDAADVEEAVRDFEAKRLAFLDAARAALERSIS
jgi:hypothetical protein